MKLKYFFTLLLAGFFLAGPLAFAQKTVVSGVVKDEENHEPLPFVTIRLQGSNFGAITDAEGNYSFSASGDYATLEADYVGYKPYIIRIVPGTEQILNINLSRDNSALKEVVVKGKKGKYHNKHNPAVALIQKVIDHKSDNKKEELDFYEYEKYEKLQFALSNVSEKFKKRKAFKKFQFIFSNIDSTKLEGKPVLPVYLNETISDVYYRKSPQAKKEKKTAVKKVGFEGYLDNEGLDAYLKYLYQDINIYDNNITILTNKFLSPIAGTSPLFYKFFILDTVQVNNAKYVRLNFYPRNKADFLFQGQMFITLDSSFAVKKIDMAVNKDINLNWVKELKIVQEYEKDSSNKGYLLSVDELSADFGLSKDKMGIYGQRSASYRNFKSNVPRPDSYYSGNEEETVDNAEKADSFWVQKRHLELSDSEKGIYTTIDSVKKVPAFKRTMDIFLLLLAGYKSFGPIEVGPVNTFYSFNPVEGFRLRAGGRTTPAFSKRINFETYAAYGFKDEKWKYYLGTTYSFTKRSIYEFPVRSLRASFQRDTKIPGQELQFIQEDNFLLSFKRGQNNRWLYNDIFILHYLHEMKNHFSFELGYKNWTQSPAGEIHYNTYDYNNRALDIKSLQTSEVSLTLRWAPNEKFYQGKAYRIPITYEKPVYTLRFISGIKGLLGGAYNYQNLTFNITKRIYLGQLGYTEASIEGGKIFGTVPFPLLNIHRANQTYSYQLQSYNLMNFLEFVSDEYANLNLDHQFRGLFFNRIPLFKKLKWREAIAVKVLYGKISSQNDPARHQELYLLPVTENYVPLTYSMNKTPYIEGSVAICNIFKFFRLDLVKRFTYTDHPNISTLGLRGRFKFDF